MTIDTSSIMDPGAAQDVLAAAVDWTQYDGNRVSSHGTGAIYLAMWGQLFAIPDGDTFNSLFNNWDGILNSDYLVDNMPRGAPLDSGSFIMAGSRSNAQYLVTFGQKFHIPDPATVSRFNFHGPIGIPQLAANYIPTGQSVS